MSRVHEHQDLRATRLHFSGSLRSHGPAPSATANKKKQRSTTRLSGSVRAQAHTNRSGLYGKPFTPHTTTNTTTATAGVGGSASAGGKGSSAPNVWSLSARSGQASVRSTGRSGVGGAAPAVVAGGAQHPKLRPPTHLPTFQTHPIVTAHIGTGPNHSFRRARKEQTARLNSSLNQSARFAATNGSSAAAPQPTQSSPIQQQQQQQFTDTKHHSPTRTYGSTAGSTRHHADGYDPVYDTSDTSHTAALSAEGAAIAAAAAKSDAPIAAVRAALGLKPKTRVNPNFVSKYFACFKPVINTTEATPLPHTPSGLSQTLGSGGHGTMRTSLFGLAPTSYTDIVVDPNDGRVKDKDESLPLNGNWSAHRASYDEYPLYGSSNSNNNSSSTSTTGTGTN